MNDEELDEALSDLAEHDVGTWRREHARLKGHRALANPTRVGVYTKVVEPVLVGAVCAVHLLWAFGAVAAILLS